MTDSEKLDLLLAEISGMKSDMQSMKSDMQSMKSEIQDMKSDIQNMKSDIQNMKSDIQNTQSEMQEVKQRITQLQLHIENKTDKNIQLLAENHIELTNKLNQAIPAASKNLAYEVKVNYLIDEVTKLKEEIRI